jgi:hypothetical protein
MKHLRAAERTLIESIKMDKELTLQQQEVVQVVIDEEIRYHQTMMEEWQTIREKLTGERLDVVKIEKET